jgi:peptidoglycan/LPS O-acetylase OafA/YrhL
MLTILVFILLFSLVSAHYLAVKNPTLNFYIVSSRLWEFLSGAIILLLEFKYKGRYWIKKYGAFFGGLGLFLILLSVLVLNDRTGFSMVNVVPVIGTCLLIFFYKRGGGIFRFTFF